MSLSFLSGWIHGYSRAVFLIDWALLTILLTGYRLLLQRLSRRYESAHPESSERKRALIWGAGDAGDLCLRYLQKEMPTVYEVVGFVDDDPQKRHLRLNGVKVLGDRHHLGVLMHLYQIQKVFVAIPSAPAAELHGVLEACRGLGLQTRVFQPPAMAQAQVSGTPGAAPRPPGPMLT